MGKLGRFLLTLLLGAFLRVAVTTLYERIATLSKDWDDLVTQVQRQGTVIDGAVTAFSGLEQRIAALETAATDAPTAEAIRNLAVEVGAESDRLAAAIATVPGAPVANPTPPPTPPEEAPPVQPAGGQQPT